MLKNTLAKQGNFLFRWRSYIPLLLLIPGVIAMADSPIIEARYQGVAKELWALWAIIGVFTSFIGLAIRWITVGFVPGGTSGRNTKEQRAEFLNTNGIYSIVRNPLYIGNYLAILGITISLNVWWFPVISSLAYWLYIERVIAAEEEFLAEKFGADYLTWANNTPAFVPAFAQWNKPDMAFSYKTVLRREYNGVMAVGTAFFLIKLITDVLFGGAEISNWLKEEPAYVGGILFSTCIFLSLRTIKKYTKILQVAGR